MHKFLRAVGFSKIKDRNELTGLITDSIQKSSRRGYVSIEDNVILAEFMHDYANEKIGLAVCGEFDEQDKFIYEYYYPYLVP